MKDIAAAFGDLGGAVAELGRALAPLEPVLAPLGVALGALATGALAVFIKALEYTADLLTSAVVHAIETVITPIELMTVAIGGVVKAVQEWGPAFKEIPNGVRDAVSDMWALLKPLPGQMMDVGIEIVEGIAKGIYERGEAAVKAAINWLTDLIPGWAKEYLGIRSPSEVMAREVGEPIGQGIAVGIERKRIAVVKAMEELAGEALEIAKTLAHGLEEQFVGAQASMIKAKAIASGEYVISGIDLKTGLATYTRDTAAAAKAMAEAMARGNKAFGISNPNPKVGESWSMRDDRGLMGKQMWWNGTNWQEDKYQANGSNPSTNGAGFVQGNGGGATIILQVDGQLLGQIVTDQLRRAV
jgi:hypothetical protein